ncbi:MAG: hypothetical protein V1875_05745 [Candidatus Altiarchaeota archaeon]
MAKEAKKLEPAQLADLMERLKNRPTDKDAKWKEWYDNSGGGAVYRQLEKQAQEAKVALSVSGTHAQREVYTFGDDVAYRIKHLENDDTMGLYISVRDWQKTWFRQALIGAGQTLDMIHLIDLTLTEGLGGVDSKAADKFLPKNLANDIGAGGDKVDSVKAALAEAMAPMVQPAFTIRYGDGKGDLQENYRLVPASDEVKLSCMNVTDPYVSTMRKVLDNYEPIKAHVKAKVMGGA